MMKKTLTYLVLIGVFTTLTWFVLEKGNYIVRKTQLIANTHSALLDDKAKPVVIDSQQNVFDQLLNNIKYPLRTC
jgi:hypothetical protein